MIINKGWKVYHQGEEDKAIIVDLPYDAMFREERNNVHGGDKVSSFDGRDYVYEKDLDVPAFEKKTRVYFEIEGAYHDPVIYINGKKAYSKHYGYSDFYFEATDFIVPGQANHIRIEITNSDQPNSRWYSGAGLYRDVHVYYVPDTHIKPRSFGIRTKDYKTGEIEVKADFSAPTASKLVIKNKEGNVVLTKEYEASDSIRDVLKIENPQLWNTDTPYLYSASLEIQDQTENIRFGIRQIQLDTEKGFLINGKRVIIYGACIHSDNGLLGAETYPDVERRKIRMIKEAGYNGIRSAHNPMVKSFLDIADEEGLLVMDEYVDCWYIQKTKYDYTRYLMDEYEEDLKDLVEKDYNHPSVVLYSTGNEVAETSFKKGIEFTKTLTDTLHALDDSRPVTCGINVFFNGIAHTPISQYSEGKAEDEAKKKAKEEEKERKQAEKNKGKPAKTKRAGSSDIFNDIASLFGAKFMANGAKIHLVDKHTREAFANMDIAGYNYGILRYKKDLKKYPNRFILGSETFCSHAGLFYDLAQKNPRVIGDMVWTGLDYLGEAGFSAWVNCNDHDYTNDKAGWLTDGGGRIDITGDWLSEMDYTRVCFHQDVIAIGTVSPYEVRYKHSGAAWKMSRAYRTWTYEGEEGQKAELEVYTYAPYAELYLNGKLLKKFKNKHNKNVFFLKHAYEPGELKAIAYDEKHCKIGETVLKTAGKVSKLTPRIELQDLKAGEHAYIHFEITDENGEAKHVKNELLTIVDYKGGKFKAFGNAAPWNKEGYLNTSTKTYQGKSLAIFEMDGTGDLEVTVRSEKYGECKAVVRLAK